MKSLFINIALIAFYFLGAGHLVQAQNANEPLPCDYKKIGLDAAKFYVYLTQDTPYQTWSIRPGKTKLTPGKEPHGEFVTTYVNPAALESIVSRSGMAYGSLVVTENYTAGKKMTGLMVMLRIKGFDPQAGDWYWFHYDPQGAVLAEGRVGNCIKCHRTINKNDYAASTEDRE